MPLDIELRQGKREFRSLQEWEQRLFIPARALLHHASQGRLKLFVQPPPMAVEFALYRDDEGASPLSESPLIRLPKGDLVGFIPDASTLSALMFDKSVDIDSFDTVICDNLSWDPSRGLVPSTFGHTFRPIGWRAGVFRIAYEYEFPDEATGPESHLEINTRRVTRSHFAIRPDHLCIRDSDVRTFIDSLRSHDFISDLYRDGGFVTEFPPYVSGKLKEMVEANRIIWRASKDLKVDDRERRRAATRDYLDDEFRALCKKGTNPDALIEFAAEVCDPSIVPDSRRLGGLVTPDLLALFTAAKLFWSPVNVENDSAQTHPSREEVSAALRFMGMTTTNAASAGATVIRPELAIDGKVGERAPFFSPPHYRMSRRPA